MGAALYRGLVDIAMTLDGDIMLDDTGDIALVSGWEFLHREINKRIRTNNPSWKTHPDVGVTLRDFIGQPNTRHAADTIKKRIIDKVSRDNIAFPGEIDVSVVPVDRSSIMITVYIYMAGTRTPITKLIYDFTDGIIQDVDDQVVIRREVPVEESYYTLGSGADGSGADLSSGNRYQAAISRQSVRRQTMGG